MLLFVALLPLTPANSAQRPEPCPWQPREFPGRFANAAPGCRWDGPCGPGKTREGSRHVFRTWLYPSLRGVKFTEDTRMSVQCGCRVRPVCTKSKSSRPSSTPCSTYAKFKSTRSPRGPFGGSTCARKAKFKSKKKGGVQVNQKSPRAIRGQYLRPKGEVRTLFSSIGNSLFDLNSAERPPLNLF